MRWIGEIHLVQEITSDEIAKVAETITTIPIEIVYGVTQTTRETEDNI